MKENILEIKYRNGRMIVDLNQVASFAGMKYDGFNQKDFRKLLSVVDLSDDYEELAARILKHLKDQIKEFPEWMQSKQLDKIRKLIEITKAHFNIVEEEKEDETMMNNNTTSNEKYFAGVKTLEELRNRYRDLLKANHPDNGGTTEATQEINAQYAEAFKILKAGAVIDEEGAEKYKWSEVEDEAIREALYKVIHLDGLNIEIVGSWIWVDGDTFTNKDALKEAGYKWSKARQKWHFAPYESKWHKGSKKSFDQLRRQYGSASVENETREKIAG